MIILIIDSTSNLKLSLFKDDKTQYTKEIDNSKNTSEEIIKIYNEALNNLKIKTKDIDYAICITGPGSFTGIRLSMAFLSGLKTGVQSTTKNKFNIIQLSLFQAYLYTEIKNKTNDTNYKIVKINTNNDTKYAQIFSYNTLKAITNPYEYTKTDFENLLKTYDKNEIIETNKNYDIKELYKYITNSITELKDFINQPLLPCYIRPHYAKPISYIIKENNTQKYPKYTISNEEKEIGFIEYQIIDCDTAEIINIEIEKQYQNKGAGKYLLTYFISQMKKQEKNKILLEVRKSNETAKHIYTKYGFKQDSIRKNYYSNKEDAILMSLTLSSI